MIVLDTDRSIELSSIKFGTLYRGDTKRYPSAGYYFIYSLGDYHIWMSFDLTGFPSDVTFTLYFKREDETSFSILTENDVYPTELHKKTTQYLEKCYGLWYIEISVSSSATFSSYNPVLRWSGHDSSTG